jgi:hypothetical protein
MDLMFDTYFFSKVGRLDVFESEFKPILHPFIGSSKNLILKRVILDETMLKLSFYSSITSCR